jgi:uncharacterized membrane protein YdjX (TVP38/TMEM64 family)
MLPATVIYVNAGSQLVSVENTSDLLSWRILLAFAALAALPFVAKAGRRLWERGAPCPKESPDARSTHARLAEPHP